MSRLDSFSFYSTYSLQEKFGGLLFWIADYCIFCFIDKENLVLRTNIHIGFVYDIASIFPLSFLNILFILLNHSVAWLLIQALELVLQSPSWDC